MTILPKLRTKFGEGVGVELFISPPDLKENEFTFLNTDYASGVSSFAVDNGLKFAVGEYGVTGNIGAEKTELVRIHTATAPTATTITLNASTSLAHSRGDIFQSIPYNQIVIESSTDGGSNYSVVATISIRVDSSETYYNHTTGTSTEIYRVRFKNEADTTYSSYSDGIIATGYADNSAGAVIREALVSLGEEIDNQLITKEFLFSALEEGRREIDNHLEVSRWSFREVFDYDAGNVIPGQYRLTLPTNLRDKQTYKNILALRIGKDNLPLTPKDKKYINECYQGIAHTTLNGAVTDVDTSITLTSSGDIDESGAVDVAAGSVSGTIDSIAYTANNESTNVISGVTGIATGGHSSGADVWQGASFGYPLEYTVDSGVVIFSQPFEDDLAGENIWLDYYKDLTKLDSDTDTFDEPFYSIYIPYLRYRIKLRKDPKMQREQDDDYKSWVEKREAQVKKEFSGQDLEIRIDLPC